ncbi:LysE family transporter [Actinosynnema sp. NPDC047251]|uniref:Lysine exporter protein (LysE/YggA) n=1 Tax=Saccharothrix espanaensis (strain ATCC 51144 / DSM 44229 / JCM 9112 / NBRC 15066 / NRRL 15764) TaxID=1179773 RepID=K0JZ78_SACES|nr:LysE family transporter [Saccharothrix espanaensis]CCH29979.1 Lysine exporter protein (LysE/YggA) [Saccharothrix espanaensis DSM 44229]
MTYAVLAGLGTGLSLIVVIGAQNALVLRQGVLRQQVVAIVAICAVSDALLIALGVGGVGTVLTAWPPALTAVRWFGAAFLIGYGVLAVRRMLRPTALRVGGAASAAIVTCLALTWLNPHVYLDTVVLLGTASTSFGGDRWWFGLGAMAGSVLWFTALGFGARRLSGVFTRPSAWRVLDGVVAVVVTATGVSLALG